MQARFEEKQTDVKIALDMVLDAAQDQYDSVILVTADSDLGPGVDRVREIAPAKKIMVLTPPCRFAPNDLVRSAHLARRIKHAHLSAHLLPDTVPLKSGRSVTKPQEWT